MSKIFLVVAVESTHDGEFKKNIAAFRERLKAEAAADQLTAEVEEKRRYNYILNDLLNDDTGEPEPKPGETMDGNWLSSFIEDWRFQREVNTAAYMRKKFPKLSSKNLKPTDLFDNVDEDYCVEEMEISE